MNSKNVFLTNSFYKEHPTHLVCSLYSDINTKEVEVFWSYVQTRDDGTVRVAVERPVDLGFDHAECFLPAVNWFNVEGFSIYDLDFLTEFARSNAPFIWFVCPRRAKAR